ncbi:hypothetical protein KRX57_05885 [Weeksellaceae bacterium TAE3-ERU29]|nr:hypothetical protein [Weeksellaceae bacterium TAE3-ERU29]
MKTKIEHTNILKSFLILLFIGIYFFSVTPVHVYAHNIFEEDFQKTEQSSKHDSSKQKGCDYYKYVSNGLGSALVGNTQILEENKEYKQHQDLIIDAYSISLKDYTLDSKSLRAPPFMA